MILQYGNEIENNITFIEAEEINVVKIELVDIITNFYKNRKPTENSEEQSTEICELRKTIEQHVRTKAYCADELTHIITGKPLREIISVTVVTLISRGVSPSTYVFDIFKDNNISAYIINNNCKAIQKIA